MKHLLGYFIIGISYIGLIWIFPIAAAKWKIGLAVIGIFHAVTIVICGLVILVYWCFS